MVSLLAAKGAPVYALASPSLNASAGVLFARIPPSANWEPCSWRHLAASIASARPRTITRRGLPEADQQTEPAAAVWNPVRAELKASLPDSTYRIWIAPLRPLSIEGSTLHLACPEPKRTWIERRYAPLIRAAMQRSGARALEVAIGGGGDRPGESERVGVRGGAAPLRSKTFERFVIGPGNRLAHAAALVVAEAPGQAYNPLFLHGPPGLGKSHLLGAIANYMSSRFPGLRVLHTTAEAFTNEFLAALAAHDPRGFKERHRDLDALLIDDVHFLEGKHHTQEEFFHTFNALHESGGQIVLCADRPPSELGALTERLRDRFDWGLLVALERPDEPTRRAVLELLRREAPEVGIEPETALALAEQPFPNLRQLEGAFTQVAARASLTNQETVRGELRQLAPNRAAPVNSATILDAVAAHFDLGVETLCGRDRHSKVVWARQAAIHLCRRLTPLSLNQIGAVFSARDHTTIMHALRQVERRLSTDASAASELETLRAGLAQGLPQPPADDRSGCENQLDSTPFSTTQGHPHDA